MGEEGRTCEARRAVPIEDPADERIAAYRILAQPEALVRAGLFVAETRLVVRRLLERSRFKVRSVLVTPAALAGLEDAIDAAPVPVPVFVCPQAVMDRVAGLHIHRGCLAIGERPTASKSADEVLQGAPLGLVLERVADPDNVGALFRCAAAFGAGAVLLGPGCGDPLYRKAIRTSMGATLQVPYAAVPEWPQRLSRLKEQGFAIVALTPATSAEAIEHFSVDRFRRTLLLVGTEGKGLQRETLEAADHRVRIRMADGHDSLNVATAAAIALHRLARLEDR
jgi:tRNA G18 (ribose-2'-O)-methylase SpoU